MKIRVPLKDISIIQEYYENLIVDKLFILDDLNIDKYIEKDTLKDFNKLLKYKIANNYKLYFDTSNIIIFVNKLCINFNIENIEKFIYDFENVCVSIVNNYINNKKFKQAKKIISFFIKNDKKINGANLIAESIVKEKDFKVNIASISSDYIFSINDVNFYISLIAGDTRLNNEYSIRISCNLKNKKTDIINFNNIYDIKKAIHLYLKSKGLSGEIKDISKMVELFKILSY